MAHKRTKKMTRRITIPRIAVAAVILIGAVTAFVSIKACDKSDTLPQETMEYAEPQEFAEVISEPIIYNGRYSTIPFTDWEIDEMAGIVFLEANNQPAEGQQAVAEVILNRVLSSDFPDTIHEVIHQGESKGVLQFTTVKALHKATPGAEQYRAINAALYGVPVLPLEVMFFSNGGENDREWGQIGDHIFCYSYSWSGDNE